MTDSNENLPWEEDFLDIYQSREELEKVEILDTTCFGTLKEEVDEITGNLRGLREQRPDCSRDKVNYDAIFAKYRDKIDELNGRRKKLLERLKSAAKAERYVEEEKTNIDLVAAFVANYQKDLLQNDKLREYIEETRDYLSMRIRSFQTFTEAQIAEARQLCGILESYDTDVDELLKDTHKWMAIEHQSLSFSAARIPTETSSLDGRPEEEREVATI
jgi:chromosome segregation ATPase